MKKEKLWEDSVKQARQLILNYETYKFKVAACAIRACDMGRGGRQDSNFSLVAFAKAIGINSSTLFDWVDIQIKIIDKLSLSDQDLINISYCTLSRVARKVKKTTSKENVRFVLNEELARDPSEAKWSRYLSSMDTVIHNGLKPEKLLGISESTLKLVILKAREIISLYEAEIGARARGINRGKMVLKAKKKSFKEGVKELNSNA